MKSSVLEIVGLTIPCFSVNTLIIGSGAASLNAALRLFGSGQKDIAIATERWGAGTSNNAGSDKQTYYKQSLYGQESDSPIRMAEDLFSGGSMHGDIALCEAQNSSLAFFNLIGLGVPFPHDRFGGYVGYKTDHDPLGRGTSAGPLTSHLMFEAMAGEVKKKGIPVLNDHEIIVLLTQKIEDNQHVIGAVALDKTELAAGRLGLVLFNAVNVVLGTGGPGGIYRTSVYPESQLGSHGLALSIGAVGQNLTESQFGLASIKFRWNLSGTYQQVIPRYVSTDLDGRGEEEFLNEYFPDMGTLATAIFLKGYQWPFDPKKVRDYGSSLIDVLVYQETVVKGRRVFLDYTANPTGGGCLAEFSFENLGAEAYKYLEKSGVLFGTPIERLKAMNLPAVDLYKEHDIDLEKECLEIAVCAQHNNGGLRGNVWWESNIKHLFPVGEVNGSHGVYRPGGSALNAGQVGSQRAAFFITKRYAASPPDEGIFAAAVSAQTKNILDFVNRLSRFPAKDDEFLHSTRREIQGRMSSFGAHIRDPKQIEDARNKAWDLYARIRKEMRVSSLQKLPEAFKNLDLCLTHAVYLDAIVEYIHNGGKSRGSFLVLDMGGQKPCEKLGEEWRFSLNEKGSFVEKKILEVRLNEKMEIIKNWVDIRPIPREESWFENIWKDYLADNFFKT
jgi:succinate dehydrogenase/fumarate reductase flavoprotein subunit